MFLTINIFDRYCSTTGVDPEIFNLVGCVAMLLAAKYRHDFNVPNISQLCGPVFTYQRFVEFGGDIGRVLRVIGAPTVDCFLPYPRNLMAAEQVDSMELAATQVDSMVRYISEIILYHPEFVNVSPSLIARLVCAMCCSQLKTCIALCPEA